MRIYTEIQRQMETGLDDYDFELILESLKQSRLHFERYNFTPEMKQQKLKKVDTVIQKVELLRCIQRDHLDGTELMTKEAAPIEQALGAASLARALSKP